MTDTARESSSGKVLVCPFCGKSPEVFPSGDGAGTMIDCLTPGCVNPHVSYYGDGEAARVWNTRAALPTPDRARVEVLEEAARMCERLGGMLPEEGARDELGWPMTPLGAARHQSFALADAIRALAHTTAVSGE